MLSQKKGKRGILVRKLTEKPDTLLTTILLGNNLVNIAASAIATQITLILFGSEAISLMTGLLTLIILIFAEVSPKRIAIAQNERIALFAVYPVYILSLLLKPFIWFIEWASSLLTRFFTHGGSHKLSLEGLLHIFSIAREQGVVGDYEDSIVRSVFRLDDVKVQSIITHRTDVFSIDKNTLLNEAYPLIKEKGFSRVPVYDGDPENIVGIFFLTDAYEAMIGHSREIAVKEIMRQPVFISSRRRLKELLFRFKKEKINIAVVLDEYGGLAGIVTREDIIEELLGELYDEDEERGSDKITKLGNGQYRLMGETTMRQIKDTLHLNVRKGTYSETVAGYVMEQLDHIPAKGESIEVAGAQLTIEHLKRKRIISLICTIPRKE